MTKILIGVRGSPLALWQANYVRDAMLAGRDDLDIDLKIIKTKGDEILKTEIFMSGSLDKGLFTKEIENELLAGEVHMAVHSLKDLPTELVDQRLTLTAITVREDPADVLVGKAGLPVDQLPQGAEVLTGSLRRKGQLLNMRPDLRVGPVRGNVQTRLKKLAESGADAMLFARAGLVRAGLQDNITQRLDPLEFLPACGQGALAIEIRADDDELAEILAPLDHMPTRLAVSAERAMLADLGGGCQAPVGAYGRFDSGGAKLTLSGMICSLRGEKLLRATVSGTVKDTPAAMAMGQKLAQALREQGCQEILDEVFKQSQTSTEKDS